MSQLNQASSLLSQFVWESPDTLEQRLTYGGPTSMRGWFGPVGAQEDHKNGLKFCNVKHLNWLLGRRRAASDCQHTVAYQGILSGS